MQMLKKEKKQGKTKKRIKQGQQFKLVQNQQSKLNQHQNHKHKPRHKLNQI